MPDEILFGNVSANRHNHAQREDKSRKVLLASFYLAITSVRA